MNPVRNQRNFESDFDCLPLSKQREHSLRSFNRLLIREKKFLEENLIEPECVEILLRIVGNGTPFYQRIGEKFWSPKTRNIMASISGFHKFVTHIHRLVVRTNSPAAQKYCSRFMKWIQNYGCPKTTKGQNSAQKNCPEVENLFSSLNSSDHRRGDAENKRLHYRERSKVSYLNIIPRKRQKTLSTQDFWSREQVCEHHKPSLPRNTLPPINCVRTVLPSTSWTLLSSSSPSVTVSVEFPLDETHLPPLRNGVDDKTLIAIPHVEELLTKTQNQTGKFF
mmetsp:Transcript_33866/g.38499  ORF Transcript_33866/g.38499 Transcript_33866/m.38499 type:complete len:279 (-) Transcript_33866:27-863(-)